MTYTENKALQIVEAAVTPNDTWNSPVMGISINYEYRPVP
jgi:hypothetical protein